MFTRIVSLAALVTLIMLGQPQPVEADHGGDGQLDATSAGNWAVKSVDGQNSGVQPFTLAVPAGATDVEIRITEGPGNSGDADLYVWDYNGWFVTGDWLCRPYTSGSTESCTGLAAGKTYYVAVKAWSSFTDVAVSGEWATAGAAASASNSGTSHVEFYKDNLFLGLAYHRIGCATDYSTITSDRDFDGYSDGNYCRKGESWQGPLSHGASAWMSAHAVSGLSALESCGASTNEVYGTPNYSRRGDPNHANYCSYNVLTDCNSDCWIQEFGSCLGIDVPIISPCW